MKEELPPEKQPVIQPCTATQLAAAYGVSPRILRNWLKPHQHRIGPRIGYYYNLEQLHAIIEILGMPPYYIQGGGK